MNILKILKGIKHDSTWRGRSYSVGSILCLAFLGLMCNQNTIEAIHRFGKRIPKNIKRELSFGDKMPSSRCISRNLKSVDCKDLENAINGTIIIQKGSKIINIDGKVLRGSKGQNKAALHIVSAFVSGMNTTLSREFKYESENEVGAAMRLIERIKISGSVITGDAIFTQQDVVEEIVKKKCYFALTVKNNQSTLKSNIISGFDGKKGPITVWEEELTKKHGRIEKRKIEVMDMPWEYLCAWRHIKQVCRITRTRIIKKHGKWIKSIEVVYLITNLSSTQVTAEQLLKINKKHWSIENKLHLIRDMTFDEDRHTLRDIDIVSNIVALRDLVIHILYKLKIGYKVAREHFAHKPHLALRALTKM